MRLASKVAYGRFPLLKGKIAFDTRMSVKIRLKRGGAKNNPAYRIVVADSRSPRDGKFIEELGSYAPTQPGTNYKINVERAQYWMKVGAQPSETVASLIKAAAKATKP